MANQIDIRGVDALGQRLSDLGDDAPKAVLRAMRRTRTTVMTRLARAVAQASGLPVGRVRKSLHGSQPSPAEPDLTITLWGGRSQLIAYGTAIRQTALPPHGFRARMPRTGHVGFFERRPGVASLRALPGRAKSTRIRPGVWHTLPIDEVYGPPLTSFVNDAVLADILREGGEVFRANLEHEIAFREGPLAGVA